jgi:hypothetical protein
MKTKHTALISTQNVVLFNKTRMFCLLIIILSSHSFLFGQKLLDIYKKGIIHLVPEPDFGKNNNWNPVFKSYYDTIYGKPMGNRKSLIILPDGSILVNNRYRDFYTKFSANGNFEKEFYLTNKFGKPVKKTENITGIINNNFYTQPDNMGNLNLYDFNGKWTRTLKLNYSVKQMVTLSNNTIAVVGWSIWKNQTRDFVALVNIQTNKETVVWEHLTNRPNDNEHSNMFYYAYYFKSRGGFSMSTMPYTNALGVAIPPQITNVDNKLIVAIPSEGKIMIFSQDGKLVGTNKTDWAINSVSVEEQKEIQHKAIEKFKIIKNPHFASWATPEENMEAYNSILKNMEKDLADIKKPIPIPAFSTIIKDSDGNLLFFEFPKETNTNKFNVWVFQNGGKFLCKSSFECDDFDLDINPSKMIFYKGFLYSLQVKKNVTGVPLRLVKFKIQ